MNDESIKRANEILNNIIYATVATVTPDDKPWNSPVAAFIDPDCSCYWASWANNQHSQNIHSNQQAFIVIYDSQAPEGTGEGVYLECQAEELSDPQEIETTLHQIANKFNREPESSSEFLGASPRRFYRAVPQRAWLNGEGDIDGHYIDTREEIDLEDLRALRKSSP